MAEVQTEICSDDILKAKRKSKRWSFKSTFLTSCFDGTISLFYISCDLILIKFHLLSYVDV